MYSRKAPLAPQPPYLPLSGYRLTLCSVLWLPSHVHIVPFLPFVPRPSHSNFAVQKVRSAFPPPAPPPQPCLGTIDPSAPSRGSCDSYLKKFFCFNISSLFSGTQEGAKFIKKPLDQPFLSAWGRGGCGREEEEEGSSLAVPWANRAKWLL